MSMSTSTSTSTSMINSSTGKYAMLFFGCVLLHLAGTWSLPLIDRDEPRFAEATREMIQRGDYIVPYFNNNIRFDKPPLTYWAQAASYKIFGENDFAARFPSTIAAALIALTLLAWGARIGGDRVGWWAAIIFTVSLQTFVHAKAAVADMWLVLFMTLAYWADYELTCGQKTSNPPAQGFGVAGAQRPTSTVQWNWWLVFYLSLALAFLAKGPIGWVPLLTVGWINVSRRPFRLIAGVLLMLGVVAIWAVPALIRTHGEFFSVGIGRHVIGRSIGAMEGHGANSLSVYLLLLPFYFITVFLSMFPWSLKFPWLVRKLWRNKVGRGYSGRDRIDNYLLVRAGIIFLIFTLIKTKLPHYTLPAFPLLALLLARHWSQQPLPRFKGIAIATTCVLFAVAFIVPPLVARSFPAYALFRESRDQLRPDMEFGAVDYNEPSLVWYFRSRVKGFLTPLNKRGAADFMAKDWTALRGDTEFAYGHALRESSGQLENIFNARLQPRQRQAPRSYACNEIGMTLISARSFTPLSGRIDTSLRSLAERRYRIMEILRLAFANTLRFNSSSYSVSTALNDHVSRPANLSTALPTQAIVDVNGVGYEVLIPLSSYDKLPVSRPADSHSDASGRARRRAHSLRIHDCARSAICFGCW